MAGVADEPGFAGHGSTDDGGRDSGAAKLHKKGIRVMDSDEQRSGCIGIVRIYIAVFTDLDRLLTDRDLSYADLHA